MTAGAWFLGAALIGGGAVLALAGLDAVAGWLVAAGLAGSLVLATRVRAIVLVVVLASGGVLASLRIRAIDDAGLAAAARRGARVVLVGTLLAPVLDGEDGAESILAVREIRTDARIERVRERVAVTIRPDASARLGYGDVVVLREVTLRPLAPDGWRFRRWQVSRRLAARAAVDADDVVRLPSPWGPRRLAAHGRRRAAVVADRVGGGSGGLLLGITIGDTSRLYEATLDEVRVTGLTHLVAVSGSNIALVLGAIALVLRALGSPPSVTTAVLLAATAWLAMLTLFEPSVVRASIMVAVVLALGRAGARTDPFRILGATAFVAGLSDPFVLLELGFQLSILATLGLLVVARRLADEGSVSPLRAAIAAAVGAQVATMPLLALQVGTVSIVSIPANLLVALLVPPATLIGFIAIGAAMVAPPLAVIGLLAWPFLRAMSLVARTLAVVPFASVPLPDPPVGFLVLAGLIVLAVAAARRGLLTTPAVLILTLAVPMAGGAFAACSAPAPLAGLTITLLDVGQGDAILVRLGEHAMLIDGGDDGKGVPAMLRARRVSRLDYVVVSHAHDDHVSGLVPVLARLPVGAVLDPGLEADLRDYRRILRVVERRGIPYRIARAGQSYPFGEARIDVLWPSEPLLTGTDSDLNENSIVLRVVYGSDCILLAGETQELAQAALLARDAEALRCEVLKVSHHGSARMDPAFYRATQASIALVPVGPNGYGHPSGETLAALHGMRVLRTDTDGVVEAAVDGADGVTWRTQR